MAERIEYQGEPLPSGLPGFGGGTISVLTLPGFNRVVAVQTFGPAVDAPVTPPSPTPPPGNTPENPTPTPVTPAPPPSPPNNKNPTFCKQCGAYKDNYLGENPMIMGQRIDEICIDCNGKEKVIGNFYVPTPAASDGGANGIFWGKNDKIMGVNGQEEWYINSTEISLTSTEDYDTKPCTPKKIKVCVDGEVHDWWILAYDETDAYQEGGED